MKRYRSIPVLIILGLLILAGCSKPPETAAPIEGTGTASEPASTAAPADAAAEPDSESLPAEPIPCTIAFDSDRDANLEIYVMGPDGSNLVNLTQNPADDFNPAWSPDGSRIAFVSNRESGGEPGQFIYVMNADGSSLFQLSTEPESQTPDWSNLNDAVTYSHRGDIFRIGLEAGSSSTNLTNSPERDVEPMWSPDGSRIVWIRGEEGQRQIFIMDTDGSDPVPITSGGDTMDFSWTVDGRIFLHWADNEYGCFNCVMNADGTGVVDGGGKGTIQEFLPFWTADWQRVELISGEGPGGDSEVFLVSEIFPDIFLNLTNNTGNDRNAVYPAFCGPVEGESGDQATGVEGAGSQPSVPGDIVLGIQGLQDDEQAAADVERACGELQIECVRGETITELAEQDVDMIVSFSNRWSILGDHPERQNAADQQVPFLNLNAEAGEYGNLIYNLDATGEITRQSLAWMFESMGGEGRFVYYNHGENGVHQSIIEAELEKYPGISAVSMPASYDSPVTSEEITELISSDPEIGAIWTDEFIPNVFWGVVNQERDMYPFVRCEAKQDMLQGWVDKIETDHNVSCITFIEPGGIGYEGVYVAYYLLAGLEPNPESMGGPDGNTFLYDVPVITSENVAELLENFDEYTLGAWGQLVLPSLTPEEIRARWFLE